MAAPLTQEQRKQLIVTMTGFGSPLEECALAAGITKKTILQWKRQDPAFRADMAAARARMQATLKQTAFRLATGAPGKDGKPQDPSVAMLIFMLKTQCGWRERDKPLGDGENHEDRLNSLE